MLLRAFPDIYWLKKKIVEDFSDQEGPEGATLPDKGWPTVALNVNSLQTERSNIRGPFSLFMNVSGESLIGVGSRQWRVNEENFLLTYPGEYYDLIIPEQANIFNVHFGTHLFEDCLHEWSSSNEQLLENPGRNCVPDLELPRRSYLKNRRLKHAILNLQLFYEGAVGFGTEESNVGEEELLFALSNELFNEVALDQGRKESLTASKKSTRQELLKRLFLAVDYMHSTCFEPFSLDRVSQESMLSKFHFVRLFKEAFHQTPKQYWNQIRLERSIRLLMDGASVVETSRRLGFEQSNAFTKFFRQHTQEAPSRYIQKISNFG